MAYKRGVPGCCCTYPLCITVTGCNGDLLSGVSVSVTLGATTYTGTTNGSGVVCFDVTIGTWSISVTASGVTTTTTVAVSGTTSTTVSMTSAWLASLPSTLYLTTNLGSFTLAKTGSSWKWTGRTYFSGILVAAPFLGANCGSASSAGCPTEITLSFSGGLPACFQASALFKAAFCPGSPEFSAFVDGSTGLVGNVEVGASVSITSWSTFSATVTWNGYFGGGGCSVGDLCYGLTVPISGSGAFTA